MKILVTPKEACEIWNEVSPDLTRQVEPTLVHGELQDPVRLVKLLQEVDGAILALERVTSEILEANERLRVISRFGVGYDAIDQEALKAKGIRLTITEGATTEGVARQAVAFLLATNYHLKEHSLNCRRGEWKRFPNRSCSETTLGIVGVGKIGSEVARLAVGLGFVVIGFDLIDFSVPHVRRASSLQELVQKSDVVSLHVPVSDQTRGMISGEALDWFQDKGLINTARGMLVDETAILKALDTHQLHFYATDVFQNEPATGVSLKLAQHDRVLCTPHIGAMDHASALKSLEQALANAIQCLQGNHKAVKSYVL